MSRSIQLMWEDGYGTKEISESLKINHATIVHRMWKMRNTGWNLPTRDANQRKRPKKHKINPIYKNVATSSK
jgi:uncharacterized protein YjcR